MYTVEEFDDFKQKVLKYVIYKKRTEKEIRAKFKDIDSYMLEDMIEFLKEQKYIDDKDYIIRSVNEFMALKDLSMKEMKYKLLQKGIDNNLIEDFFNENYESLFCYEVKSARKIYNKKINTMEENEVKGFLYKKGYAVESITQMLEEK